MSALAVKFAIATSRHLPMSAMLRKKGNKFVIKTKDILNYIKYK